MFSSQKEWLAIPSLLSTEDVMDKSTHMWPNWPEMRNALLWVNILTLLKSYQDQSRHLADQNSPSELWNLVTSLKSLKWFNLKCFVILKKIWLISWHFEDIEQTLPHRFRLKKIENRWNLTYSIHLLLRDALQRGCSPFYPSLLPKKPKIIHHSNTYY